MKTICEDCGKIFEAQGNETGQGKCYNCALTRITGGRPPEIEDFTTAGFMSGEMSDEEWRDFQAELRRYHPGDFVTHEEEFCKRCGNLLTDSHPAYDNHYCYSEADRLADEEDWRLSAYECLYDEAIEEDLDRKIVADQEAQQAKWDAQIVEWERLEAERAEFWAREQEWNDSYVPILYDILGSINYDRFAAPVLIGWLRFKKRWRH